MKRILSLLSAFALLLSCLPVSAEETGVVVRNYRQLAGAVNEQRADRILISAKYRHGTDEIINLTPRGRTVTVLPENGESAVINGRVDVSGPGSVIFQNITIVGPEGGAGLWAGSGADVTVTRVKGGRSKKNSGGCPAAIVDNARLTAGSAAGSDCKYGFGGDGIYAFGDSTVTVGDAAGGSASKGFGGSGAVVFGGAKITVTGSATGGDGLYAAGKGVLAGLDGAADGKGALADGSVLEGKKTMDPDSVTGRSTLEHALRSGRTEILLSSGFKAGSDFHKGLFLFCSSEEPIRIFSASPAAPVRVDCPLYFCCGTWNLEGIRFSLKSDAWAACLWADGSADVTASGSMTAENEACGIFASGGGRVEYTGDCSTAYYAAYASGSASILLNGNVSATGKGRFAAGCDENASVTVNGGISVHGDSGALACYGGKLTASGPVRTVRNKNRPAVLTRGGEIILNGPVNCEGQAAALSCKGGSVTVNGDVTGLAAKKYAVELAAAAGEVTVNGTLTAAQTAIRAEGGSVTVNGELIIVSNGEPEPVSQDGGTVTVTGGTKTVSP